MSPSKTLAEDDLRRVLSVMDADVQASLALTRALYSRSQHLQLDGHPLWVPSL